MWDVTVGFMGWTSMPGTLAESEKRFDDLQSFMPFGLSVVLAGHIVHQYRDLLVVKDYVLYCLVSRESPHGPMQ